MDLPITLTEFAFAIGGIILGLLFGEVIPYEYKNFREKQQTKKVQKVNWYNKSIQLSRNAESIYEQNWIENPDRTSLKRKMNRIVEQIERHRNKPVADDCREETKDALEKITESANQMIENAQYASKGMKDPGKRLNEAQKELENSIPKKYQ